MYNDGEELMPPETTRFGYGGSQMKILQPNQFSQVITNLIKQAAIVAIKQRNSSQIFLWRAKSSMEHWVAIFPTTSHTIKLCPSVASRKSERHIFNRLSLKRTSST
jgi:hypothetical protein